MAHESDIYQLLQSPRSFRLLKILPQSHQSVIACELFEVILSKPPKYEALSYTWGSGCNPGTITINGTTVSVHRNLHDFLCQLQNSDKPRTIWVDALCIRQDDANEKGQQVAMIGEIFQAAHRVLVWFGEHANDSKGLFEHQKSVKISSVEDLTKRVTIWNSFFARPYWKRLWIVQEIILARQKALFIHCGGSSAEWEAFFAPRCQKTSSGRSGWDPVVLFDGIPLTNQTGHFDMGAVDGNTRTLLEGLRRSLRRFHKIFNAREKRFRIHRTYRLKGRVRDGINDPFHICNLMNTFAHQQCMDTRDKVYALLSLEKCPKGWTPKWQPFRPDYNCTEAEIAIRLCLARLPEKNTAIVFGSQKEQDDALDIAASSLVHTLIHGLIVTEYNRLEALQVLLDKIHASSTTDGQKRVLSYVVRAFERTIVSNNFIPLIKSNATIGLLNSGGNTMSAVLGRCKICIP